MAQVVGYSEISISEYADGAGLYDSIPYYLASSQSEGVTIYDEGWSREVPVLTPEKKYLWIYYVSRYSAGTTEPEILTVYGNPAVVEYEGDDAPADKVLVEIEPDIAQGMDQTPYIYRAVSDSSVTDLKNHEIISEITGGTVAWNQLLRDDNIAETIKRGVTWSRTNGKFKLSGTASSTGWITLDDSFSITPITDHVYIKLLSKDLVGGTQLSNNTSWLPRREWSNIGKCTSDGAQGVLQIQIVEGTVWDDEFYAAFIDLTQMFGTTIADYIYSLEQSTAGAGVSLFKSLFPKDYYAYNAGELMSVKTSARETVGKNLLNATDVTVSSRTFNVDSDGWITAENKTSDPRPWAYTNSQWFVTLPKGTYCLTLEGDSVWKTEVNRGVELFTQDSTALHQTNTVGNFTFTLTETTTCGIMAKIYGGSIRLQIEGGSTSTSYEPYQKHTYPLSNIELRGIPKLVNNKLTYDGDIYKANGSVERRYGVVVIDENSPIRQRYEGDTRFYIQNNDMKRRMNYLGYVICDRLQTVINHNSANENGFVSGFASATGYIGKNWLHFSNGVATTIADIKAWLASNPLTVVYELATPTTETANPYTEIQICDADGTEEFIDDRDVQIPVGHKTSYIQAYDDIHMEHWGKNLFELYTRSDSSASGVTWSCQGDSLTARGTATGNSYAMLIENNWMTVEESIFGNLLGKQITISGGKDGIYMNLAFRKNSSDSGYQTNWVTSGTITVPTDGSYQVYFNARAASGWSGEVTIHPQVELGSTATDYEPYYHENLSFSLGEPVYGGTVDVANYKTTKKYGMIDLGTLTWTVNTAGADGKIRMQTNSSNIPDIKKYSGWSYTHILCSRYPARNINVAPYIDKSIGQYNDRVLVYDSDYTDAATFKAAMDGVYLIYELAEPEESTFQP